MPNSFHLKPVVAQAIPGKESYGQLKLTNLNKNGKILYLVKWHFSLPNQLASKCEPIECHFGSVGGTKPKFRPFPSKYCALVSRNHLNYHYI